MMVEPKQISRQNLVPKKSRKQYLDEIIQKLNENGKFSITILLDDQGMILAEYSTTVSLEKEAIAAMFSLIHNVKAIKDIQAVIYGNETELIRSIGSMI